MTQNEIDQANRDFWNELCGSQLARALNIKDDSSESLARFDRWYLNFYPYLYSHIPFDAFAGRRVLEVGLGYGTVAELIIKSAAMYSGLDIAKGPVSMVNRRIANLGQAGVAVEGTILAAPFVDEQFDYVVAIGSLHHTGALDRALDEIHRLLKPGGEAIVMVYNALSYRQWVLSPVATVKRVLSDPTSYISRNETDQKIRGAYDADTKGDVAPQTEFVTKGEIRHLARRFSSCEIKSENIGSEFLLRFIPRKLACSLFGSLLGLDLYCRLRK